MRRPLVIYDFASDPFGFPYTSGKFYFIFLSVYIGLALPESSSVSDDL
jgi:hypothetical protein